MHGIGILALVSCFRRLFSGIIIIIIIMVPIMLADVMSQVAHQSGFTAVTISNNRFSFYSSGREPVHLIANERKKKP